jgi:hypothetical protein
VNTFENVLLPPIYNVIDVYVSAEAIVIWYFCELYSNIYTLVSAVKNDHTVRIRLPVLEFPFHLYFLALLNTDVLALDSIAVHSMQSTRFELSNAGRLCKLTQSCLVGNGLKNK